MGSVEGRVVDVNAMRLQSTRGSGEQLTVEGGDVGPDEPGDEEGEDVGLDEGEPVGLFVMARV